ncbi:MAG: dihydropteroate synthase [Deltaproteobacteria bacterium]|nr:dihydropteroate synthase [Deltaproteobacteria bacterium]TLN03194.1 MAG: dihydropteroate synthase [bacterium]
MNDSQKAGVEQPHSDSDVWTVGTRTLHVAQRPHIMGILNVTPDSFSDGSLFLDPRKAVDRALEMEAEGADSIDIGGESTRPFAPPVDENQELRRVLPVIEKLAGRLRIPISIDTYKASVAREALRAGAEIVNDISGGTFDPRMLEVVSTSSAGLIVMHTRGKPTEMQQDTAYSALIPEIISFLRDRLSAATEAGISATRIVVDPGIGFGKSLEGNLEILRNLEQLAVLDRPILVGTSRKSFIGTILGRETGDRAFGTAATIALAVAKGASIFRVHDVRQMRDAALIAHAVMRPTAG